ncbi:unnamed protein product [Dicrocoelium dendriticum]|nr:unnamed protein product [Dicrocoelium dendriticum]
MPRRKSYQLTVLFLSRSTIYSAAKRMLSGFSYEEVLMLAVQLSDNVANCCEEDKDPDEVVHNLSKLIAKAQVPASFVYCRGMCNRACHFCQRLQDAAADSTELPRTNRRTNMNGIVQGILRQRVGDAASEADNTRHIRTWWHSAQHKRPSVEPSKICTANEVSPLLHDERLASYVVYRRNGLTILTMRLSATNDFCTTPSCT